MAGEAFSRVWWRAHAKLSILYRWTKQKPGVENFLELARAGLTLYELKPRRTPYGERRPTRTNVAAGRKPSGSLRREIRPSASTRGRWERVCPQKRTYGAPLLYSTADIKPAPIFARTIAPTLGAGVRRRVCSLPVPRGERQTSRESPFRQAFECLDHVAK